jgi:hypothetical protein
MGRQADAAVGTAYQEGGVTGHAPPVVEMEQVTIVSDLHLIGGVIGVKRERILRPVNFDGHDNPFPYVSHRRIPYVRL